MLLKEGLRFRVISSANDFKDRPLLVTGHPLVLLVDISRRSRAHRKRIGARLQERSDRRTPLIQDLRLALPIIHFCNNNIKVAQCVLPRGRSVEPRLLRLAPNFIKMCITCHSQTIRTLCRGLKHIPIGVAGSCPRTQ
jgi:hypothetical protein